MVKIFVTEQRGNKKAFVNLTATRNRNSLRDYHDKDVLINAAATIIDRLLEFADIGNVYVMIDRLEHSIVIRRTVDSVFKEVHLWFLVNKVSGCGVLYEDFRPAGPGIHFNDLDSLLLILQFIGGAK